jgi:hypothetical protein
MPTTINTVLARLKSFDVSEVAQDAIIENSKSIADQQRHQMLTGLNSKGEKIGKYRNASYARKKAAMNPLAGGSVDLKLTGAFHRGIFVADVRKDVFVLSSTDEKTVDLANKYNDPFGMNEDSRKELVNGELGKGFIRTAREKLKL